MHPTTLIASPSQPVQTIPLVSFLAKYSILLNAVMDTAYWPCVAQLPQLMQACWRRWPTGCFPHLWWQLWLRKIYSKKLAVLVYPDDLLIALPGSGNSAITVSLFEQAK